MSDANKKVEDITPTESAAPAVQMVTMPVETLNKAMAILGSLPYQQVAEVLAEIQQKANHA